MVIDIVVVWEYLRVSKTIHMLENLMAVLTVMVTHVINSLHVAIKRCAQRILLPIYFFVPFFYASLTKHNIAKVADLVLHC